MRSELFSKVGVWAGGLSVIAAATAIAVVGGSSASASAEANLVDGGIYLIGQAGTSKVIDDPQSSPDRKTKLIIYTQNGDPNQQWEVTTNSDGSYSFQNQASKMCMDDSGASMDAGSPIIQWDCSGHSNQKWNLVASGTGYALVSEASALSVTPDGTASLSTLSQQAGTSSAWNFTRVDTPPSPSPSKSPSKQANAVTISDPGAQTGTVGSATSLQVEAMDSDSTESLTYAVTGLPAGLSINAGTGAISGTPTAASTSNVTVTATDSTKVADSASFTWTVDSADIKGTPRHEVTIVVETPKGSNFDQATEVQQVRDDFAGAAKYWLAESGGLVDLELVKIDWAPGIATCDQGNANESAAVAESGFTAAPQRHIVAAVRGCNDAGVASVNRGVTDSGWVAIQGDEYGSWTHEFGHNFSFGHADLLVCPGSASDGALTTDGGQCTYEEYADNLDTMSVSWVWNYKGFSTPNAISVGFIPASDYVNIDSATSTDRTITINTRDKYTGLRSVQITDPRTGKQYWVELATHDGYDNAVSASKGRTDVYNGVTYRTNFGVRVLSRMPENSTLVLAAPPVNGERATYWAADTTFTSASGGITVKVLSTTATTATVEVKTFIS